MSDQPHGLPDWPCHLNGRTTTLPHAQVSVMDRGFIFGDAVYEVIPAYAGRLFCFGAHMARLERSLAEVRIANPHSPDEWLAIASHLIAQLRHSTRTGGRFDPETDVQAVYLQVTRGVALRDHVMPQGLPPTVFLLASPMRPPTAPQRAAGVACVTADDFRWRKAHIKTTSLLGAVLARQIGADAGAVETVMFRDGWLSEGAASNVWVVKDGAVAGPPADELVLEGVRYGLIESLCRQLGIPFALRPVARDEVMAADELLLSSAGKEVLAVTTLDGRPVGSGRPGPVGQALYTAYQQLKSDNHPHR